VAFGTGFVSPGDASPKTTTKELRMPRKLKLASAGLGLICGIVVLDFLVSFINVLEAGEFNPFGRVVTSSRIEHLAGSGLILAFLVVLLLWYLLKTAYRVQHLKQQIRELGGKPQS
jgi:uncharacterized membrane protein